MGRLLRHAQDERMDPYAELFLFLADRSEHTQWIRARLREGNWVVCDRYAMSSAAYQGTYLEQTWEARGQDPVTWIMDLHRSWWLKPDLTVLIVDDVERCLARVASRGRPTKFERAAYLRRVQDNYRRLAEVLDDVAVVDEPRLEHLVQAVLGRVEALLGNSLP
jgi:dTMP kinase